MSDALVPITEGDARRDALIRAVGFDKLSEPQRELALAIAQRYELDPMLKHVVMIEGRPYITRDGLLHVAHRSGVFDGIEVSDPVLDETADTQGRRFWRARCTVYRKDFSRPFVYPGRYPLQGGNAKYAEEMAVKVAEVMTLRRAFDVSAPTVEERWDGEFEEDAPADQPSSLAERVAQQAAAITGTPDQQAADAAALPAIIVAQAAGELPVDEPPEEIETPDEPANAPNAWFTEWASTQDRQEIIRVTRTLYPDIQSFGELDGEQLAAIRAEVMRAEALAAAEPQGDPELPADDEPTEEELLRDLELGHDEPEATQDAPGGAEEVAPESAAAQDPQPAPGPFSPPVLCGAASPLTDATCTLDAGHKGVHRAGLREAW